MQLNKPVCITLATVDDTQRCAAGLAPSLRVGDVLLLSGEVGAGKTTFAQALIRALAGQPELEVTSPTFTLLQTYETPAGTVWHYDLYRVENAGDLEELALEEAMEGGITLIEWPEVAASAIRQGYVSLAFSLLPEAQGRAIEVQASGTGKRLQTWIRETYGNASAST